MPEWGMLSAMLTHFHFLRPWWLLALIPFSWALRQLWLAQSSTRQWQHIIAPHLLNAMLIRQGRSQWLNPVNAGCVLVILGIVAVAGPTWQQQPSPFSEDVKALVIILDASESMQQKDVQPSRLERAKQKIQDLLALRPGGLSGLIVYAGSAHTVIPLTNDSDVIKNFLNAISTDMMPRQGKAPEKALPIADTMLRDSPVPGTILMIGDGIGPDTGAAFQAYFAKHQHQLLILGTGQEKAPEGNADGFIPLERRALQTLVRENHGYYQPLTLDKEDIQKLNRRIDSHLVMVDEDSRPWLDMGYVLLFPLALIMLLWFRKGWTLHWCMALLLIAGLSNPGSAIADAPASGSSPVNHSPASPDISERFLSLWLTPDQLGMYYLKQKKYQKAAASFDNIAWRGIAYYRAENFKAAADMFSRIETAVGYFNLGNAYAHSRHYLLAVKSYDQALKLSPDHAGARKNRDKIQQIIDEINQLSASQQAEEGDSTRELGDDDPQTAEGAERKDFVKRETTPLTAEALLLDDELNEMWMRQVQKDPSRFLSAKFQMQLQGKGAHNVP